MKQKILFFILYSILLVLGTSSFATKYDAYKSFLQGSLKVNDISKATQTTQLDKNSIVEHCNLAYLYLQDTQQDKALQMAEELKKLDNNNPKTASSLVSFYMITNKTDLAKKFWKKTLKLDHENEIATAYIAFLYQIDNKLKESLDYWIKFSKQQSENPLDYLQLGNIQEKLGLHQEAIKLNPKHFQAFNYLGHSYAQQGIKLDLPKEFITKSLSLEAKNINFMNSLGLLYLKMWKFYLAEKTFLYALSIAQNTLTYTLLGDTYLALKNYTNAWIAYSLSYDFKQDKYVEKKLRFAELQIPKEELYNLILLRSKNNYDRLLSFKTGFKTKISSKILSRKFYISITYNKKKNIQFSLPYSCILSTMYMTIENKTVRIEPKATKNEIPQYLLDIIYQSTDIFNDDFYKQFLNIKPIKKGDNLTYSKDDSTLTLDYNTALIKKFSKNNIIVEVLKYENFVTSKIPTKIKIFIPSTNIKITLTATKISQLIE